jgi:carbamoyltransferase
VYPVKAEKRDEIPAVVFVDGSGRLQTVSTRVNSRFHKLISAFEELTGVPVLLNTSFNLNGEPIVCSPTDAIRTFFSCGLDALVIEDWLILKQ